MAKLKLYTQPQDQQWQLDIKHEELYKDKLDAIQRRHPKYYSRARSLIVRRIAILNALAPLPKGELQTHYSH